MNEVTITLTEEQERFLKLFATNHYEGAPDNLATHHPLFIVKSKKDGKYVDVAYFFILEEAKRYIKYQSHNLVEPKIYGNWAGYSNDGEYHHFYTLLLSIGKQLRGNDNERYKIGEKEGAIIAQNAAETVEKLQSELAVARAREAAIIDAVNEAIQYGEARLNEVLSDPESYEGRDGFNTEYVAALAGSVFSDDICTILRQAIST